MDRTPPENGSASPPRPPGDDFATEAERVHTPRTPARAFAGVWVTIAVVVAVVVALTFIAYFAWS